MQFTSSSRDYRLKHNTNQAVRGLMLKERKSVFVEAVCYLLEGITTTGRSGEIDFDLSHAFYIHDNGTWGARSDTVLTFINWAKKRGGKTVKKYLEEFLEFGIQIFDEELAQPNSQVIPKPPTWREFLEEKEEKKKENKKVEISTK